jgi:hypothetical protein
MLEINSSSMTALLTVTEKREAVDSTSMEKDWLIQEGMGIRAKLRASF